MRYVHPLTDEHRNLLEQTMKNDASPRARARAHSLLLSVQGLTINEIAKIYHVDRDTVSTWLTKWEQQGEGSLQDQPRSGRPPTLTPEEQERAIAYIKEEPRSLKQVVDRLAQKTAKRLSISALKRLAKRARKIDLYYFDESGFALDPSIPYAWQASGEVIELPAMRYGRINV